MARVIWTEAEQDTLYTETATLLKKNPKLFIVKAVNSAQAALPPSRRRRIVVVDNLPEYLRKRLIINQLLPENWRTVRLRQRGEPVSRLTADEIKKLQNDLVAAKALLDEQSAKIQSLNAEINAYKYAPKPKPEIEVIKDFLADIMGHALVKARMLNPTSVDSPLDTQRVQKHNPFGPVIEKNGRKPRVVIVGTKPEQASILQQEFSKGLDLRFYVVDTTANQLKVASENADVVILWTDFINHSTQEAIPREKRLLVSGGMTSMRAALQEIEQKSH